VQWTGHPSKLVCSLLVPAHIGLQTSKSTWASHACESHNFNMQGSHKICNKLHILKTQKSEIHHVEQQQQTEGRQAGKSHSGGSVGKGAAVPSNTTTHKMKHPLDLA